MKFLRRHPELLLFATIIGVYTSCVSDFATWSNNAQDSITFMDTAKYFGGLSLTPTYAAIAHVGSWFPNDAWGMTFVGSTLPAIGACILVFYAVKKQTQNKWAPYVGAVTLAASCVFLAHATVIEFRTSVAFFIIAGYTALVYGKGNLSALSLGLAVGCHSTAALPAIGVFLLWNQNLRRSWWLLLISAVVPIVLYANFANLLWPGEFNSWSSALRFWNTRTLTHIPYNIGPISAVLIASLGLSIVPAIAYLIRVKESWPLVVIISFPIIYALTSYTPVGHVQFVAIMPLLAVAAGLGIERLIPKVTPIVVTASCIMLLMLPMSWNSHSTSAQDLLDQFETVEDNAVIICQHYYKDYDDHRGMYMETPLKAVVNYYNSESGRNLQTLHLSAYSSPDDGFGEREALNRGGLNTPLPKFDGHTMSPDDFAARIIKEFAESNPNIPVYIVRVICLETNECVLERLQQ